MPIKSVKNRSVQISLHCTCSFGGLCVCCRVKVCVAHKNVTQPPLVTAKVWSGCRNMVQFGKVYGLGVLEQRIVNSDSEDNIFLMLPSISSLLSDIELEVGC